MATRREAHDGAARRLRAAIAEQDRLTYRHEAAVGTAAEASADAFAHHTTGATRREHHQSTSQPRAGR